MTHPFVSDPTVLTRKAGHVRTWLLVLATCLAVAGVVSVLTSCDEGSSTTAGAPRTTASQPAGATSSSLDPATPVGSGSTSTGPATTAPRTGAILFAAYCAGCHGNDGKAKLTPTVVGVAAATVKSAAEKGTGTMPGFADRLSPADIDAVVTYVGTLK